jgi:hypothetical protein
MSREAAMNATLRNLLSSAAALLLCMPGPALAEAMWTGPLFDAHLHYNDDAAAAYSVGAAFELFSKNGVKAVLANSRPNDGSRALFESKRKDTKVVPFIRVYRNRADYGTWFSNPEIYAMIEAEFKRGYYRGIGEFHLYGRDANSEWVRKIVDFAVANNLVLHAHCDEEALEILFAHNPKTRIIWAHTGFTTPLSKVEDYLNRYPGLWGELSYRGDVSDSGKLNAGWRALFTKHPGRFLVGSDTWVMQRWQSYPQIMGLYRSWLGEMPREVASRIAWDNGAQLFGVE